MFVPDTIAITTTSSGVNPGDALSFSFSISGGVSLGSYEAGVNWALLHYLKIQRQKYEQGKKQQRSLYPELSSLSGASAGSINALFSAISWCVDLGKAKDFAEKNTVNYRFQDTLEKNLFRDIWVKVGIENLLPDPAVKGKYATDDGLFTRHAFDAAINNLKSTLEQAIFREDCQVPFGITVTRVKPGTMSVAGVKVMNQRFMIPFRIEVDKNNKDKVVVVSHRVNTNDADMGNVMYLQGRKYPGSVDQYIISTDDLIDSILTSSAYPIAFGRKKLNYCSQDLETKTSNTDSNSCPEGFQENTDVFLDGGLFDNVPLGIAKALAEPKPTDSVLKNKWKKSARRYNYIYIDPTNQRNSSNEKKSDKNTSVKNGEMTYGLRKQLKFLTGAINTGRNYELYNMLRGGDWSSQTYTFACQLYSIVHNSNNKSCIFPRVSTVSNKRCNTLYRLIDNKENISSENISTKELVACLVNSSLYLEREYTIKVKNSKFRDFNCKNNSKHKTHGDKILGTRHCLLQRLGKLANKLNRPELVYAINEAGNDDLGDRRILITSRFAPVTGNMLGYFGAFLDKAFREYDYYAGIYDAIYVIANYHCERNRNQRCLSERTQSLYQGFKISSSAAANTVFILLAKYEHLNNKKNNDNWQWLNDIKPTKSNNNNEQELVSNIKIIFKSLTQTVTENNKMDFTLFEEFIFFSKRLLSNNYNTHTVDSSEFMKRLYELKDEDSSNWFYPISSRIGARLIQLENYEVEK